MHLHELIFWWQTGLEASNWMSKGSVIPLYPCKIKERRKQASSMFQPSAFEWQVQRKNQRQQRGSNGRRMLTALPAGQAAGSKITWNLFYNRYGVTLFKEERHVASQRQTCWIDIVKRLEADRSAFCWAGQHQKPEVHVNYYWLVEFKLIWCKVHSAASSLVSIMPFEPHVIHEPDQGVFNASLTCFKCPL